MILVENNVIIEKMDNFEQRPNGKLINGVIYPMGKVIDIDVGEEVIPQKHCYSEEKGVYINPNFKKHIDLGEKVIELESLIADLIEVVMGVE